MTIGCFLLQKILDTNKAGMFIYTLIFVIFLM